MGQAMPKTSFDAAAYLEEAAALLGLDIDPKYKPGIVANLEGAAAVARAFLDFPLADDDEAGPVFRP
jgi:hypothetical protein